MPTYLLVFTQPGDILGTPLIKKKEQFRIYSYCLVPGLSVQQSKSLFHSKFRALKIKRHEIECVEYR